MMSVARKKRTKTRDELVAETLTQAFSFVQKPPSSLTCYGNQFIRNVLWKPSALKVYSVDLGCKVSKSLASSFVSSSVLSSALGAEISAAASLTSAAQAQAIGLLALRIPLTLASRIAGNGPATARLVDLITRYAASNATAVAEMAAMGATKQIITLGVKGSVLGAIATAAIQESIAVAYYCHGGGTFDVLSHQTATIGLSVAATVGGGTVGAAVGCIVMPGLGTAFGSLVGSYIGNLIPFYTRGNGYSHQTNEDPTRPSRKVKAIEMQPRTTRSFKGDTADLGGGWLEVVDCSTESYFRFGSGPSSDSLALLREYSLQEDSSPSNSMSSLAESSTMCGFDGVAAPLPRSTGLQTRSNVAGPNQTKDERSSSWISYLNPLSYVRGPKQPETSASPAPTCSTFFVRPGEQPPTAGDDEVIIYFQQLNGEEEERAISHFDTSVASSSSFRKESLM